MGRVLEKETWGLDWERSCWKADLLPQKESAIETRVFCRPAGREAEEMHPMFPVVAVRVMRHGCTQAREES